MAFCSIVILYDWQKFLTLSCLFQEHCPSQARNLAQRVSTLGTLLEMPKERLSLQEKRAILRKSRLFSHAPSILRCTFSHFNVPEIGLHLTKLFLPKVTVISLPKSY